MNFSISFFINSIMLGVGMAMDAFSVSLANGLHDTKMSRGRMCLIAGTFSFYQFLMPMLGWVCVHTVVEYFGACEKYIPIIGFVILLYIGGKMLTEGIKGEEEEGSGTSLSIGALMIQGIATSIDALSVGFTIGCYNVLMAIVCALIIAVVTFLICYSGLIIGKKFGTKLSGKASILGGAILIFIGFEILITSLL